MTGPTHVAIAISFGMLGGASGLNLSFLAAGALLPDVDTYKSIIGRILLPISIPLNKQFGHRGVIHSFWLWGLIAGLGSIWHPLLFVGIGGLCHVVADCWTVSGVRAMAPFSTKLFVLFQRSWRFRTGGSAEIGILLVAGTIAWTGHAIGTTGGLAATLGYILKSPKIMLEEYIKKGTMKCSMDARFRNLNGHIEEGVWQIIGLEGSTGIAFLKNGRIVRTPKDGKLLKARLITSDSSWVTARLQGWYITKHMCYYLSGKEWKIAHPGDVLWGSVICDNLTLSKLDHEISLGDIEKLDFLAEEE